MTVPVSTVPGAAPVRDSAAAAPAPAPRGEAAPWEGVHLRAGLYRWGLAGCALLGAALRVAHIARPFNRLMAWNEGHYAMIALNFDRYGLWSQHNELGVDHTFPPGVPWLIWAAFKAFGPTEWAARLPIVLFGIAAVVLVGVFARRLFRSEQVALIAAAFAAVAPGLVYFSQNVQLDTPSICAALAAAVLMLRYRDTRHPRDLVWAGLWLALAVWFKYTTALLYPVFLLFWWPARPARPAAAAGAFVGATALPSAAWVAAGWFARQDVGEFYHRYWDPLAVLKAVSEIPLSVEAHLFVPIFLLLLLGIPIALRRRASFTWLWVWCVPWLVTYVVAPWDSLTNRYYDLPATYALITLAAVALWRPGGSRARGAAPITRGLAVGLILAVGLTVAYDLWDPVGDRIARATTAHPPAIDPSPFYSAKIVAALPRGRTIVDTPQTMFYAGGDPRWIDITGGDVRWKIDGERYAYVVLNDYGHGQEPYYRIDDALRTQFAAHGYVQIGPAVWAHLRTRIADLGGYRDPNTPAWAPRPPWPSPRAVVHP